MKIPIAHTKGRFHADDETINNLIKIDRIIFKYCYKDRTVNNEFSSNESLLYFKGICNKESNVFGAMLHTERAADTNLSI